MKSTGPSYYFYFRPVLTEPSGLYLVEPYSPSARTYFLLEGEEKLKKSNISGILKLDFSGLP